MLKPSVMQLHHLLSSTPPGYPSGPTTWIDAAAVVVDRNVTKRFYPGVVGIEEVCPNLTPEGMLY